MWVRSPKCRGRGCHVKYALGGYIAHQVVMRLKIGDFLVSQLTPIVSVNKMLEQGTLRPVSFIMFLN